VEIVLGSKAHRDLFCEEFVKTHLAYDPNEVEWPELDEISHRILTSLPIWTQSVNAEHETAVVVRAMADQEPDPVIAEAIALQAFEEERHAVLVRALTDRYSIAVVPQQVRAPRNPQLAFVRSGWSECLDSFFAFGFYAMAREAGLFPPAVIHLFDQVMQEEARHIVFFENWRRFQQSQGNLAHRSFVRWTGRVAAIQPLASRVALAVSSSRPSAKRGNFILAGAQSWESFSLRRFLETCLTENQRRLAPFDLRLLRPQAVPTTVRRLLAVLG
jgi:hypothetical protein